MVASLAMYDRPETRAGWDALWATTVQDYELWRSGTDPELPAIPRTLSWDGPHDATWLKPDLTLSQACSLPYRTRLHGKVTLLGAFDFNLPGCPPGYYNSVLVMRADDDRQAPENWAALTLAYNAPDSQSGWAAPYDHAQMLGTAFKAGLETGSHAASARAVAEGRADIAALDAQSFRLLQRYDPVMSALREIGRTEPTPGLPLITRRGWDSAELWAALSQALDALPDETKTLLDLRSLTTIHTDRYLELPLPPAPDAVFAS
jgi:hypothetical protein